MIITSDNRAMPRIYEHFAHFYETMDFGRFDRLSSGKIHEILSHRRLKVKSVLDLACGNGVASVILAKRGIRVTGIDSSANMLELAEKRARSEGMRIDFIRADMRHFRLPHKFDLAVCLYDSLNYIQVLADLRRVFSNVFDSLSDSGIFIFDMNSLKSLRRWKNWVDFREEDNIFFRGSFDPRRKLAVLSVVMYVKKSDKTYEKFVERHVEKSYSKLELKKALLDSGFSRIDLSNHPLQRDRLLCVASKKK